MTSSDDGEVENTVTGQRSRRTRARVSEKVGAVLAIADPISCHALCWHPVTGKPLSDCPKVGSSTVRLTSGTSAAMNASWDARGPW